MDFTCTRQLYHEADHHSQTGWLVSYAYNPTPPASIGWAEAPLDLVNTPDIICHLNATNAALSATVAAGETMEVFWRSWPDSHERPVINYRPLATEIAELSTRLLSSMFNQTKSCISVLISSGSSKSTKSDSTTVLEPPMS